MWFDIKYTSCNHEISNIDETRYMCVPGSFLCLVCRFWPDEIGVVARNKLYDLDDIGVYADLTGLCTPAVVAINIYIYRIYHTVIYSIHV